jgi:predicted nucleic acid-binding protein
VNLRICVDASLAAKLVLDEEQSDKARMLWQTWLVQGVELVAPCHLAFELFSVIRQQVFRNKLDAGIGRRAFDVLLAQGILLLHPQALHESAWRIASRFNRPTLYDAYYLAVGELYRCEVWTADRRLYRAVQLDLPWVKLLDYYQPDPPARPSQDAA